MAIETNLIMKFPDRYKLPNTLILGQFSNFSVLQLMLMVKIGHPDTLWNVASEHLDHALKALSIVNLLFK